ncbi:hypothetical protein FJT64_011774 [Amphibalanus amphitrite]|uniref:Uncharacterized protein n=1 Tax=Amphibalanus amphitrite TaxID=1232801 RepID=A0A6A4VA66_AMPAM|nr:hypothetical protein FJT64_011774 [Amphibalanus amphitrite]
MVAQVTTSNHGSRCIRKPRWSFKKADWAAFQAECEAAFEEAEPSLSTQELSTLFVNVLHQASVHHIPRGARADPKPWALDPELRNDITTAKRRAQRAADALVHWARQSKMLVAGEKTQLLVLSQSAADAADCAIKVDGKLVPAADRLKLLGRRHHALRLLQCGGHARADGGKVSVQAVRPASTAQSHVELLEREMRAAARTITGCPLSTPAHAVIAEAGLMPVAARRDVLAAKLLARAHALPEGDPLRAVAEGGPPSRLKTVTGWRGVGHDTWRAAGIVLPIEPLLPARAPPWEVAACPHVTFSLDIGALRRDAPLTNCTRRRRDT